jgi:hypothetical protein
MKAGTACTYGVGVRRGGANIRAAVMDEVSVIQEPSITKADTHEPASKTAHQGRLAA